MIKVTFLDGRVVYVNPRYIEKIDESDEGTRVWMHMGYNVVQESVADILAAIAGWADL